MQQTVAIITEYNPFHNGHKYQIDKIREEMPDATVVAIMSGNTVQRGDFAFVDKYTRAKMAMSCGIDAVFELPFPYSCSTAEIFATAGVKIAEKLGVSYLYFGIEEENLENLEKISDIMNSHEFNAKISEIIRKEKISYPVARERIISNFGLTLSKCSNDILAIEYIRAIKAYDLNINYRAIKRVGANYKDISVCDIMSASAIRENFYKNKNLLSIPEKAKKILQEALEKEKFVDKSLSNRVMLSSILLQSPKQIEENFDVASGMGFFISEQAKKCKSPDTFTDDISSKQYTTARLKRAIIYSLFNVKEINKTPEFTVLLGANKKGRQLINKNRKTENFYIITKHSDAQSLSENAKDTYEKTLVADSIFTTLCINPSSADDAYKKIPYIT